MKNRDTWYWIGQDEGTDKDRPLNSGFNLYSSKDLVNWKFLGQPLYVSYASSHRIDAH